VAFLTRIAKNFESKKSCQNLHNAEESDAPTGTYPECV